MRIAHVVTYISADGAYGGPVAVAMGQAEELASRGHHVDVIAGWDRKAIVQVPGVTMRLFPVRRLGRGFSGTVSLELLSYVRKNVSKYDIVHVHAARDLITLPVALWTLHKGVPLFLQPHGQLLPDERLLARVVDRLATRRAIRDSTAALALTEAESEALATIGGSGKHSVLRIANGVKLPDSDADVSVQRQPIVLFLARLHPRKRVMAFAEAGKLLLEAGFSATFRIIGPDEGDLHELEDFIRTKRLTGSMSYLGAVGPGEARTQLAEAMVYVLPSFGEVFPMTVLEAMSVGTPVVISEDCAIAPRLKALNAAVVTDGSPVEVARAIRRLLEDSARRQSIVDGARSVLRDWLSIEAVVDELEQVYSCGVTHGTTASVRGA